MGIFNLFDRFKASASDRSPWGDFFFEPVSVRSVSGMRVSADSAMRLAAVYACVRILSETMASLPLVAGGILGGYVGTRLALKIHPESVRKIVIAIAVAMTAYFFITARS